MSFIIWCIDSIGILFTNPAMYSLLGLIGFAIVIAAFRILIK